MERSKEETYARISIIIILFVLLSGSIIYSWKTVKNTNCFGIELKSK